MNEIKTERLRVERTDAASVQAMLIAADESGYTRKKFTPVSEVSHLENYRYTAPSGDKLTIVYDTKARILTIDGRPETLTALQSLLPSRQPTAASAPPREPQKPAPAEQKPRPQRQGKRQKLNRFPDEARPAAVAPAPEPAPVAAVSAQRIPSAPVAAENVTPAPKKKAAPAKKKEAPARKTEKTAQPAPKTDQPAPKAESTTEQAPAKKKLAAAEKPAVQRPVTVTGVTRERLDWVLKDLKSAGAKVRATDNADKSRSATVQSKALGSVSLILASNGTVTIAGKPGELFDDVKAKLESKSDLRLLKKHIPTALRFLSESSKIDLSNGITDLSNVGKLSDYSVLLTAPYRALEKFIYDLQQAENINVKMIGQAYEKDDEGRYSLKKGYLKRIDSVVYAEVMTALYTEYFATRNFYTHSDNSADSQSRGIGDKTDAQRRLTKLLAVLEYNAKKLSEIGFSVASEH